MKTINLLIVYDVDGWAYHHQAKAMAKYAPADFRVVVSNRYEALLKTQSFDVIFFMPFNHIARLRKMCRQLGQEPVIVTYYSLGWGYANDWLQEPLQLADMVVINNYGMWDKSGRLPKTHYIPNGVDLDIFKVTRPIGQRQLKALWTGSTFHRKIKGYDDIVLPLKEILARQAIDLDMRLIDSEERVKYNLSQMAEWYNSGAVYIVASLSEGTPNPALEAAACGCTLVSTPVGNMPELIRPDYNGYLVRWRVEEFAAAVQTALERQERLSRNMQAVIGDWGWDKRSAEYYRLFRELIDRRA